MGIGTTSNITIEGTTTDPTKITVPDIDFAYILAIKDLTEAIKALTSTLRSK